MAELWASARRARRRKVVPLNGWRSRRPTPSETRPVKVGAFCIGLVIVLAGVLAGSALQVGETIAEAPSRMDAVTITSHEPGTRKLKDGSVVDLAAHSTLRVDLTPHRRELHLLEGTATFAVAKDPKRPFTVLTHSLSATAIGTKFRVTSAAQPTVEVYEGVVSVRVLSGGMGIILHAGETYPRR
jgi:ferric-dicitrate binding protein FerR (iron transport regulator)